MKFIKIKLIFFLIFIGFTLSSLLSSWRNKTFNHTNQESIKIKQNERSFKQNFLNLIKNLKNRLQKIEGVTYKKIEFKFLSNNNRYIIAAENIRENSTIIQIPFKALYHIKHPKIYKFCRDLKIDEFSLENIEKNQFICLIFFIMIQKSSPDDDFKFYIESLPKSYKEFPQFYQGKDLQVLNYSILENWINQKKIEIGNLQKILNKTNFKGLFTIEDLTVAHIIVGSRNFGLDVGKKHYNVLAPFTDLFNYDPNPNTIWINSLKSEGELFSIFANRDIKKGEQIFVYYGLDDNEKLLTDYGFTLENNPNPPQNWDFKYFFGSKFVYMELCSYKSTKIIDHLEEYRKANHLKISFKNKEKIKQIYIVILDAIFNALTIYSNKKRLEKLRNNLNETPNTLNIYRALLAEDLVIDKNFIFVNDLLEILKGGREVLKLKSNSQLVLDNLKYLDKLL